MVEFGLWAPVPHAIAPEPRLNAAARQAASMVSGADYVDESFAIARDVLIRGDELGYDYTLIAERFLGPDLEAWLLTAALAPLTKRIRLLTAIHPGLIAPQIAAKMGASLDRISNGRFHLNLVSGWWREEWEMYGGRWLEDEQERYLREEEYIQVVKGLWTQDSFSFEGRYYQVHEASSPIKPVQQPYPPLFAASRTEPGKELLAREADWWFPGYGYDFRDWRSNLDRVGAQIEDMRERAARYGRELRFGISVQVLCAPTDEQAFAEAEALEAHGKQDRVAAIATNRLGPGLFGTPQTVAERMSLYAERGVDMFLMTISPMLEGIELFAAEVMPLLRSKPATVATGV